MHGWLTTILIVLPVAFGICLSSPAISQSAPSSAPAVGFDVVEATINGVRGLFLIDTGGAEIVLDPDFAAKADIAGVGGRAGTEHDRDG